MTDTRLSAIESRARALGWGFELNEIPIMGICATVILTNVQLFKFETFATEWGFSEAERLLALYEPGAVVEVDKCPAVVLKSDVIIRRIAVRIPKDMPPGKYKLVRWEDDDE